MVIGPVFSIIVGLFMIYYILVLVIEKRVIQDAREILEKFLAVILLYAGISIIYFSITGEPFFTDTRETYSIYLFIIGFIALLWTIPVLLSEFRFFRKFVERGNKIKGKK